MSFSQGFQANSKGEAIAKMEAYPAELEAQDKKFGASAAVVAGHQKQAKAGIESLKATLAQCGGPESVYIDAGVWGHAGEDGQGQYGFRINVSGLPTPNA